METREESIEKLIRKIRRAGDTTKTYAYNLEIRDRHGRQLDLLVGNSREFAGTDEEVAKTLDNLESKLRASLKDNANAYSVAGNVGVMQPLKKRVQLNEVIPVEAEDDDLPLPPPLTLNDSAVELRQQRDVQEAVNHQTAEKLGMGNLDDLFETLSIMEESLGVKGLGNINSLENKKMAFIIQMRDNQLRQEATNREHLGTIETQKSQITELNAEIKMMKERLAKLERENEEQKRRIEKARPKLQEYNKLKSKNARIAAVAGESIGHILAGIASHTKYGALLGIMEDPVDAGAEVQDEQNEPQEQTPMVVQTEEPKQITEYEQ